MNNEKVTALAGRLFETLVENDLTEAEIVKALAIGITLRLAYATETFEELLAKLDQLFPIFREEARQNIEALVAAQRAKAKALEPKE